MQVYSFINSADAFQWEKNPSDFSRSRLFEYTDSYVIEKFRTPTGEFTSEVTTFPALFSVESPHDVAARVGWIEKIDWKFGDPVISFRLDEEFRPILQNELKEIQWELGIEDFEFFRTHWALKQADLLKVLKNRGFTIPSIASDLGQAFKTESVGLPGSDKGKPLPSVFISYSHADSVHLKRLQVHLAPIKKWARLETWDDTKILAGDKWKEEIETALNNCSAAILLISADFLSSEFISDNELPPLLKKAEKNGTRIIPIIIKPCLYTRHPQLREFQALNSPDQSLISLNEAEQEATWAKAAQTVLDMVQS